MNLGMLVNSDKKKDHIIGLTTCAARRGHAVTIFVMDEGTRLLEVMEFNALSELDRVTISYCEHSARELAVDTGQVADDIESSSQYNNAAKNHFADKVIVL